MDFTAFGEAWPWDELSAWDEVASITSSQEEKIERVLSGQVAGRDSDL
jgi:hypothetical protein